MDRTNLEALAEEEDEEQWNSDASGSEGADEIGDGGIKKKEPNQFDSLCDGVVNCLAVVHASLQESLELKNELLRQHLPPNVLTKIAMISSKTFRSVSDLHAPVNELIRLVKLYSTPWEEKSTALKKLHEDYEGKKTQLNIAIKRLQLIEGHSKRIAKERRIMNWEKLFSKLTMANGHGRRWKFLMEGFKANAKLGADHLQNYLEGMDNTSSDEEEEEEEIETQMQQVAETSEQNHSQDDEEEEEDEDDSEDESEGKPEQDLEITSEVETAGGVYGDDGGVTTFIRPPMQDKEIWTHEPQYECSLHVRVFKPEGLDCQQLKCALQLGDQRYKTGLLDQAQEEPVEEKEGSIVSSEASQQSGTSGNSSKRPRRGLIGTRGGRAGRPGAAKASTPSTTNDQPKNDKHKYEELVFTLPDNVFTAMIRKGNFGQPDLEALNIAILHGNKEDIYAMANVDTDDLQSLEIPTVYFAPPRGDNLPGVGGQDIDKSEAIYKAEAEEALEDAEMLPFPLYSVEGGSTPCGNIPLIFYWGKRERPKTFHRATESETLQEIVYDLTGIDLNVTSKEAIFPDTKDEALSAVSFTPEPTQEEEVVPKSHHDRILKQHDEELNLLQQEYEQRLQDLADSLQEMQEAQLQASQLMAMQMQDRPVSVRNKAVSPHAPYIQSRSPTPHNRQVSSVTIDGATVPQPPSQSYDENAKNRRSFKTGRALPNWGENLPKNFFERLKLFEEQSQRNREILSQQIQQQTALATERKLADQYKITGKPDSEVYDPLQDVSLPAVFMPNKSTNINIFNPRANKYFHPTGAGGARLTQPPSMLQLPPIPKNKLSVVNLFDLSQNFHRGGPEWLMQRFIQHQQQAAAESEVPVTSSQTAQGSPDTNLTTGDQSIQEYDMEATDYDSPEDYTRMYSHVTSPPQAVME